MQVELLEKSGILRLLSMFLGAFMILCAQFGVRPAITRFLEARASAKWPQAKGVIVSSKVRSEIRDYETYYKADVQYEYSVNGQAYRGDRVTPSDARTLEEEKAQAIVDRHPMGEPRQVSYNPADPSVSLLEPGLTAKSWLLLALPFFLTGWGGLFVYAAWIARPKRAITLMDSSPH